MSPDERAFREHVTDARFLEGVERCRWRIVDDIAWPVVLVAVAAAPRENAPPEYVLRFELTGYPEAAPTATPWNPVTESVLEQGLRPKGAQVGHVFRTDWKGGEPSTLPLTELRLILTRTGERIIVAERGTRQRI